MWSHKPQNVHCLMYLGKPFLVFFPLTLVVLVVKNPFANAGDIKRCSFHFWVKKIPFRRKCNPPVFLPGKSHRQRDLAGYRPWGSQKVEYDWSNLAYKAPLALFVIFHFYIAPHPFFFPFSQFFPPPRSQFPSAIQLVSCFSLITRENTPKPQRGSRVCPQHSCSFSKHASGSGFWQKVFPEVSLVHTSGGKTTQIIHILFKAPCNLSTVIIIYQLLLRAFVWSL